MNRTRRKAVTVDVQGGGAAVAKNPISLSFGLQYGNEQSQAESDPQVFCYLSRPVKGRGVDVVLPIDDAARVTQVVLEGWLEPSELLPVDTEIVFFSTSVRDNEFGSPCRVPAGVGRVPLALLAKNVHTALSVDVPLEMPSAGDQRKGILRLVTTSKQVVIGSNIQWENPGKLGMRIGNKRGGDDSSTRTPVEDELYRYTEDIIRAGAAMPNTWKETNNVRIPVYFGDFGLLKKSVPLPAAAYFMCQVPDSNMLFWTKALDTVLARNGQVVHDVDRMTLQDQARVMAEINCLVIQSMDYIADLVDPNKRSIHAAPGFIGSGVSRPYDPALVDNGENFGDSLRTGSGDCEDFGLAIGGQVFPAFLRFDFSSHRQLKRLQEIGHQYMGMMTLDNVLGAAVGDGKRKMGAHIKCNFLPAIWVKSCMDKAAADLAHKATRVGSRMGSRGRDPSIIGDAIAGQAQLPWKPFAPWAKDLEVLIAEGTGPYEPRDRDVDPLRRVRASVDDSMPSLHGLKKPLVHVKGQQSGFFLGSMEGFTSYFFELGANVGGFWLGYTEPGCETMTRGIAFEELVNKSEHISVLAHPPFSDDCKTYIERALRVRVPPRDLVLTPEGMAAQPERCAKIEEISKFTASLGRSIAEAAPQGPAPYFIQEHQLTDSVVKGIKNDIQSKQRIVGVRHVCEHITDWMCIYRTGFYVK